MRDETSNWPPAPDWPTARLDHAGLLVRTIALDSQHLVSGNLDRYAGAAGLANTGIGAFGLVDGDRYALRIARDRMLVVNVTGPLIQPGWHPEGHAVSDVSALYHVFELEGPALERVIAEAVLVDPDNAGPSAAVVFAGQTVLACRREGRLRIHVERGHAAWLWQWLEAR